MGLRCLLGHDFSEAGIERTREEEGDQMVVTIREVKTCQRCGTERVISENKEVTSIRSPEEIGLDAGSRESPGTDADATGVADSADAERTTPDATEQPDVSGQPDAARQPDSGEPQAGDAGIEADSASPAVDANDPVESSDIEQTTGVEDDPEVDDGVILPEENQQRERGEWPETEQTDREETTRGADAMGGGNLAGGGTTGSADESAPEASGGGAPVRDPEAETDLTDAAAQSERPEPEPQQPSEDKTEQTDDPTVAAGEREEVEILDASEDTGSEATPDAPTTGGSDERRGTVTEDSAGVNAASEESDPLASDDDATAWPDHGDEDQGFDASVDDDADVSFSGNSFTPDVSAETPKSDAEYIESDAEYIESDPERGDAGVEDRTPRADVDTGIAREGSSGIDLSEMDDDANFYCPNCGLAQSAGESSLRAGDICPECRKGYIAERTE